MFARSAPQLCAALHGSFARQTSCQAVYVFLIYAFVLSYLALCLYCDCQELVFHRCRWWDLFVSFTMLVAHSFEDWIVHLDTPEVPRSGLHSKVRFHVHRRRKLYDCYAHLAFVVYACCRASSSTGSICGLGRAVAV